jgi:PAS domain S-box-containing protein
MGGEPVPNTPLKTLLLVEDEPLVAMAEKLALQRRGYGVVVASTGEEALDLVASDEPVDLVLMDIDLGTGMDGTQAAEEIGKLRSLPVVFLSGHTEPEIVERTEKVTSYGYVVKGSNITVLDASIKMAFKLFRANHLLKESEARLNRSEKISRTGNWLLTLGDGKIVGSEGACQIYGVTSRLLSYDAVHELVLPEYRCQSEEAMAKLIECDRPYRIRSKIRRPSDGAIRELLSIAEYDRESNSVYGVIQDITDA